MMSSHRHGAFPVTQAVPSIMLSNTTVMPEAGQAGVGRVLPAGAVVLGGLLHPQREPDRMVMQADHQAVGSSRRDRRRCRRSARLA